jgi:hypothetical protein
MNDSKCTEKVPTCTAAVVSVQLQCTVLCFALRDGTELLVVQCAELKLASTVLRCHWRA